MSWSSRRRALILSGIGLCVLAAGVVVGIAVFYEAPTCADNRQNADEQGVDCGGASCTYLCAALVQPPVVNFARALSPVPGRTDIVASVTNPNPGIAARGAHFTASIYNAAGVLMHSATGTTDLPPGAAVPVYLPGFYTGYETPAQAFVTFDAAALQWYRYADDRPVLARRGVRIEDASTTPRIIATLGNALPQPLSNVPVVVVVRDTGGQVVAASQTVVPRVPASGEAQAVFTWPAPFPLDGPIDVWPLLPLPAP